MADFRLIIDVQFSDDIYLNILDKKRKRALEVLTEEGERIYEEDVQGTWDTKYPVRTKLNLSQGEALVILGNNPDPRGKVPFWLNFGTRVRFATVPQGFIAKTAPRRLKSITGRGKGKFSPVANPGIKPRRFDRSSAKSLARKAARLLKPIYG